MSGRPTADIVLDLLKWPSPLKAEARARLAELDAEVAALDHSCAVWTEQNGRLVATLHAIDALRPPCPTCGGTHRLNVGEGHPAYGRCKVWTEDGYICPDCEDGKVSIEQLAATWQAVQREDFDGDTHDSWRSAFLYLRSVKPE